MPIEMDIEKIVQDRLSEIDFTGIASEITERIIKKEFAVAISKAVTEKVEALIYDGINSIFDQPVNTDDGWGKREQYVSFSELFKKVLKEKLDHAWDGKRFLEKAIKDRTDALVNTEWNRVIQKTIDELTQSKVIKK